MNKKMVESYMVSAYDIMKGNPSDSTNLTVHISSFGAALSMGSLLSAIAFFSSPPKEGNSDTKNNAKSSRNYLLKLIFILVAPSDNNLEANARIMDDVKPQQLFDLVVKASNKGQVGQIKERILSAATAIKLAINLL